RMEGAPPKLRTLYLSLEEAVIAHVLDRVALELPQVAIGSYPEFDRSAGYRVKVTVESTQLALVDEVVGRLKRELPAGGVLLIEGPLADSLRYTAIPNCSRSRKCSSDRTNATNCSSRGRLRSAGMGSSGVRSKLLVASSFSTRLSAPWMSPLSNKPARSAEQVSPSTQRTSSPVNCAPIP